MLLRLLRSEAHRVEWPVLLLLLVGNVIKFLFFVTDDGT
jgi:hypothetical protein